MTNVEKNITITMSVGVMYQSEEQPITVTLYKHDDEVVSFNIDNAVFDCISNTVTFSFDTTGLDGEYKYTITGDNAEGSVISEGFLNITKNKEEVVVLPNGIVISQ